MTAKRNKTMTKEHTESKRGTKKHWNKNITTVEHNMTAKRNKTMVKEQTESIRGIKQLNMGTKI
jgi:imidazolonepropionase-like amidohydrolase